MEVETDLLREAASPYEQWEAGELSAQAAAIAIAAALITEIEPAEQALEARKKACRAEVGILLIRVGARRKL